MSLDYVSDIQPLEGAGMTDAQIAAYFAHKTAHSVLCSEAKILLEESGLVFEDPVTRNRGGALINYYVSLPDGELKLLLGWFISHVFGRGEVITTDTQPRASQVVAAVASLPGPMQAVGGALIALGGGQPYGTLTAADVAAIRAAHLALVAEPSRRAAIDALRVEIENTWFNPAMGDGVTTAEEVRAAIKAGL
jgi:hypothetical protein